MKELELHTIEECEKAYQFYDKYIRTHPRCGASTVNEIKEWIVNCAVGYVHPRSNSIYFQLMDAAKRSDKSGLTPDVFVNAVYTSQLEIADSYLTIMYRFVRLLDNFLKKHSAL